jgi:putative phosphoesterase
MQIAVIADTHGSLPEKILPELRKADEIWHLGDFCNLQTLGDCLALGRPFYGVLGNNDYGLDLPESLRVQRCGLVFHLVHIPPRLMPPCDFLLHGHTHVPRDEKINGCRVLNPGTIGKPNKGAPPSWAWLHIAKSGAVRWRLNFI